MKKILLAMVILLSIVLPNRISALESSFYEGEYLPNMYIKKFKNNSSTGKYEQMRVFRRNSDNRVVYCLELWETLNSNKNLVGDNYINYSNIDSNTLNRIMLIAYYGYNYGNHTDIKWYGITQFMIWKEIEKNSNIYFTDTLNGNKVEKYESEMSEINELVNKHSILPGLKNIYDVSINKPIELIDNNGVLNSYNMSVDNTLRYKRVNNKLEVEALNKNGGYIFLYKQDNIYSNNPIIYTDSDGQNLLLPGSYPKLYKNIIINVPLINLTINKYDIDTKSTNPSGEANFDGITFELYDMNNKLIDTKIINNNKIIFNNIPAGRYYLKEVYPGIGYKNNTEIKYIDLDKSNNNINIYNTVIKNKIKIHKQLKKVNNNLIPEEDAVFSVYNNNVEEVLEFKTDANGYYEFELPYGTYTIKQLSGKRNYKYVDDFTITVNEEDKTQEFNLYNEELIVPIQITNLDNESNLPILESGAEFIIKNLDTLEEHALITDDFGKSNIILLEPGNYEIKQIKAITNYLKEENIITLYINDNSFSYDEEIYNIDIKNEKEKSKIEISKLINYYLDDELVNTEENNDITIPIYAKNDIYTKDGIKRYSKDEEVDIVSKLSKDLIYGDYYINNNSEIINLSLNNPETKEVKLIEDIYKYTEIDNIPNTYIEDKDNNYLYILMMLLGLYLLYWSKRYENN